MRVRLGWAGLALFVAVIIWTLYEAFIVGNWGPFAALAAISFVTGGLLLRKDLKSKPITKTDP